MQETSQQRALRFQTIEEAEDELIRLRGSEVVTLGFWSFFQILKHLADHLEFSFSGYPVQGRAGFIRKGIGPHLFARMKRNGYMPAGFRSFATSTNRIEGDSAKEMERLLALIHKLKTKRDRYAEHPLFGELGHEDWLIFHAYHIANHLGYVIEKKAKAVRTKKKSSSKRGSGATRGKTPAKKGVKKKVTKKKAKKRVSGAGVRKKK